MTGQGCSLQITPSPIAMLRGRPGRRRQIQFERSIEPAVGCRLLCVVIDCYWQLPCVRDCLRKGQEYALAKPRVLRLGGGGMCRGCMRTEGGEHTRREASNRAPPQGTPVAGGGWRGSAPSALSVTARLCMSSFDVRGVARQTTSLLD